MCNDSNVDALHEWKEVKEQPNVGTNREIIVDSMVDNICSNFVCGQVDDVGNIQVRKGVIDVMTSTRLGAQGDFDESKIWGWIFSNLGRMTQLEGL